MTTQADGHEIVRHHLAQSGTGLFTLNSDRVDRTVALKGFENTTSLVIVEATPSRSIWGGNGQEDIYTFKCYGGSMSYKAANAIGRAVHDRIHRAVVSYTGVGAIVRSVAAGLPQETREDDTEWPVAVVTARIQTMAL